MVTSPLSLQPRQATETKPIPKHANRRFEIASRHKGDSFLCPDKAGERGNLGIGRGAFWSQRKKPVRGRKGKAMFKGIIFDMDGVLINSEPFHFQVWRETLKARGIHIDYEVYKPCIGSTIDFLYEAFA